MCVGGGWGGYEEGRQHFPLKFTSIFFSRNCIDGVCEGCRDRAQYGSKGPSTCWATAGPSPCLLGPREEQVRVRVRDRGRGRGGAEGGRGGWRAREGGAHRQPKRSRLAAAITHPPCHRALEAAVRSRPHCSRSLAAASPPPADRRIAAARRRIEARMQPQRRTPGRILP